MANDQERIASLEARTNGHDKAIEDMATDIKDIKDNLLKRPSWAVSIIISLLIAICTGLTVFVATAIK